MTDLTDKVTLKIHGLVGDNEQVRADVFVEKLKALVSALKGMDKLSNGKATHEFMLADLSIGSALATVREKPKRRGRIDNSSVERLSEAVSAIYDGDNRAVERIPPRVIDCLGRIAAKSAKTFSHGEVTFPQGKIIRIDEFFQSRVEDIKMRAANEQPTATTKLFKGTAFGTFDGTLKALDARGTVIRAALILAAGNLELDCTMNKDEVPSVGDYFDRLVSVDAVAHYDGKRPLPARLEIRSIRNKPESGDLIRWIGKLKPRPEEDDVDEGW